GLPRLEETVDVCRHLLQCGSAVAQLPAQAIERSGSSRCGELEKASDLFERQIHFPVDEYPLDAGEVRFRIKPVSGRRSGRGTDQTDRVPVMQRAHCDTYAG